MLAFSVEGWASDSNNANKSFMIGFFAIPSPEVVIENTTLKILGQTTEIGNGTADYGSVYGLKAEWYKTFNYKEDIRGYFGVGGEVSTPGKSKSNENSSISPYSAYINIGVSSNLRIDDRINWKILLYGGVGFSDMKSVSGNYSIDSTSWIPKDAEDEGLLLQGGITFIIGSLFIDLKYRSISGTLKNNGTVYAEGIGNKFEIKSDYSMRSIILGAGVTF